jgi:hypothetical protein
MLTIVTQVPVILKEEKDWQPWLELIKSASLKQGLWEYINPSMPWELVPKLEWPIRPTPNTVKPAMARLRLTRRALEEEVGGSSNTQHLTPFSPHYLIEVPETKFSELD